MRILLVAHEFPPIPSPQSLRWAYLVRELCRRGHEVSVLTVDSPADFTGLPPIPPSVRVYRAIGGPVQLLAAMLIRRQVRRKGGNTGSSADAPVGVGGAQDRPEAFPPGEKLNMKGRAAKFGLCALARIVDALPIFPDSRGLWLRPALSVAKKVVVEMRPDIVVTSHEPATTLQVGAFLKKRFGLPWAADLGDPVLALYTRRQWRLRSLMLERQVVAACDLITVTSDRTGELLRDRHMAHVKKFPRLETITQGYDDGPEIDRREGLFDPGRLELLYTGSFYRFRNPHALLAAIAMNAEVRLSIATVTVPAWLGAAFEANPRQVRLLGFLAHDEALAYQKAADVLVNLANDDPCQVPGKLYEYLGSGRPVLHIGRRSDDAAVALVQGRGLGWVCGDEVADIASKLEALAEQKLRRGGIAAMERSQSVSEFGWSRLAARYERAIEGALASGPHSSQTAVVT